MSELDKVLDRIKADAVDKGIRISLLESNLRDCVNELCLKCGQYKERHLGACDGCRWLKVQEEVRRQ